MCELEQVSEEPNQLLENFTAHKTDISFQNEAYFDFQS